MCDIEERCARERRSGFLDDLESSTLGENHQNNKEKGKKRRNHKPKLKNGNLSSCSYSHPRSYSYPCSIPHPYSISYLDPYSCSASNLYPYAHIHIHICILIFIHVYIHILTPVIENIQFLESPKQAPVEGERPDPKVFCEEHAKSNYQSQKKS